MRPAPAVAPEPVLTPISAPGLRRASIYGETTMADKAEAVTGEPENKRDASGDQKVTVRALKTFHRDGDMKGEVVGPDSEPFEVDRSRAAQLRANGLIEYVKAADDVAIHGEEGSKKIADKVKAHAEQTKLPENSKTTPLVNPEVKLADAPK